MTKRQEMFIKEYILTRNGAESARKAGYTTPNANRIATRLLSNVRIKEKIEVEFARLAAQYDIDAREVTRNLVEIARNGQSETNKIKCWELLGKAVGMFKDSKDVDSNVFNIITAQRETPQLVDG